jgi:hypothetical protein
MFQSLRNECVKILHLKIQECVVMVYEYDYKL